MNAGDCVVLLGAFLLGPFYGMAAGAFGSALADLFLGYTYYAPGTLVIKGLMALAAALLFSCLKKQTRFSCLPAAVVGELWMVLGYFFYESMILGYGLAALGSVPANLVQGAVGTLLALVLYRSLTAVPQIRKLETKEGECNADARVSPRS